MLYLMVWPPQSADTNIIDLLRDELDGAIRKTCPTSQHIATMSSNNRFGNTSRYTQITYSSCPLTRGEFHKEQKI